MNTYLKITVLVLASVCLMLGALTYKSQRALTDMKPFIVRFQTTWARRGHRLPELSVQTAGGREQVLPRTLGHALLPAQPLHHRARPDRLPLLPQQRCAARCHRARAKGQDHLDLQLDASLPYVDIDVKSIVLDDLQESPYSARIEFEKVFTNPADHCVLKRERWIASVTYVFADHVANEALSVNPWV